MEHETDRFIQDSQLREVCVADAKTPGKPAVTKLYKSPCLDSGDNKGSYGKCWLLNKCFKLIGQVVVVCTIIFVAYIVIKLQDKKVEDSESIQGDTGTNGSRSHELGSIHLALTTNRTKEQPKIPNDKQHASRHSYGDGDPTKQSGQSSLGHADNSTQTDGSSVYIGDRIIQGSHPTGQKTILGGNPADYNVNYKGPRKHYFNIGMREDKLMQDCHDTHLKHSFPDIDYALLGYDIYRGYPLADEHDPGFTFPIFDADYSHGKQTADCRYSVPKGFFVVPDVSCVTSFSSEVIQNVKDLNRGLSVNAGVGGSGFGVAFSASSGYRGASSDLSSQEYVYIISTAHCNYYFSKLQPENPPPFTQIFLYWVHRLNSSSSNDTYFEFLSTFGTHFAKEITFGARFSYEHKMKSSIYKSKRENSVNIAAQASYNGLFSVNGGFSLTSEQREEASDFSKSVETRTVSVGAAPPANGDAITWASTVQNNPVPSKYKLEPIEKLFHKEYMEDLGVDYDTIRINIRNLREEYYKRIMPEGWENDNRYHFNRRVTKTLTVKNGGKYGSWFAAQFCPMGTFAIGFNVKYQDMKENASDNTALNAISLQCADRNGTRRNVKLIQSGAGHRGEWKGDVFCPSRNGVPLFLRSFALKVQPEIKGGDDTSANIIRFGCRDLQWTHHPQQLLRPVAGTAGDYGHWSEKCPMGSAICGIQTRVEGHSTKGDNTALNDVKFFCCD